MKRLLTIREQDIVSGAPITDPQSFASRKASRGVVLDEKDEVYLLHVTTHNYHKLPGGGIDEGEDKVKAMKRECLEEIGCSIKDIAELGEIVEYRDQFKLVQTSYCYLARKTGKQVATSLEEGEITEGHDEVKAKNIKEAIEILEKDRPNNYEGKFIRKRDLAILKAASVLPSQQ